MTTHDDFLLEASKKKPELIRKTLHTFANMPPQNENDRIAAAVIQERLASELALYDSHEMQGVCAVIWSPAITIRQVFEVMPHESAEDFKNFTARLNAVKGAHDSWMSALIDLAKMGKRAPKRQVSCVADQARGEVSKRSSRIPGSRSEVLSPRI